MRESSTRPAAWWPNSVQLAFFEDSRGTEDELLEAIRAAIPANTPRHAKPVGVDRLRTLGSRVITEDAFFGSRYNRQRRRFAPKPTSYTLPRPGTGGDFARAFTDPPYGHGKTSLQDLEAAFNELRDFILPAWHEAEIRDWASPQLVEVSEYFKAGMEWWGVFLFTIYVPSLGRLSAIAASASD